MLGVEFFAVRITWYRKNQNQLNFRRFAARAEKSTRNMASAWLPSHFAMTGTAWTELHARLVSRSQDFF